MTSSNLLSVHGRDIAYHFHPQTNPRTHEEVGPQIVAKGDGCYYIDEQGRRFLDMHAGLWCTSLGLSEERLVNAAVRQMQRLPYANTFAHRTMEPIVDLAEALVRLAPSPMSKVQFQSSGSEANDTAIKIAWFYWNALGERARRKVIARTNAYHGTTLVTASLTQLSYMNESFGLPLPGFIHVPHPDTYRGRVEGEDDEAYATRLADELEQAILREGPETIAAFIAEPVMGAGGLFLPPQGYFPKIQAVLRRYGILMIADEVICGFGRTGHWWGSQAFDIVPDILTCAKALSASYLPISAIMFTEEVYEVLKEGAQAAGTFGHGYTYGGHPVCAAVALEALRIYQDDGIIDLAARRGAYLKNRLMPLADHPLVGNVRGIGLMWGIELVRDKLTHERFAPAVKAGQQMHSICLEGGLNTRALGGHTMAFTPPLIISEAEIDEAVTITSNALDTLHRRLSQAGEIN